MSSAAGGVRHGGTGLVVGRQPRRETSVRLTMLPGRLEVEDQGLVFGEGVVLGSRGTCRGEGG